MKILIVGSIEGWMEVHMLQFAKGFTAMGHDVRLFNYKQAERSINPFDWTKKGKIAKSQRVLEKDVKAFQPDMIIFVIAHLRFDFAAVREYFKGVIAVYDLDGPAWKCYKSLDWIKDVDLLLTVSRVSQRMLKDKGIDAEYLPHGVDVDFYQPLKLTADENEYFGAPISFVGRPTPRRTRLFESVADQGLVLWGRRWSQKDTCSSEVLQNCTRNPKDIIGEDVVKIYSASDMMVNVLREPLNESRSIMSLQVFTVPATGTCLLTEWVEELEEAFELGKELLAFKTDDEFTELALRYLKDRKQLNEVGARGRARCLAEHTHQKRAEQFLAMIK